MSVGIKAVFLSVVLLCEIFQAYAHTTTMNASWYGEAFHGKTMANGERFNMHDPTIAAHKTLPLGTRIELVNPENHKKLVVVVKDRGPWVGNRSLDLSYEAARSLGIVKKGVAVLSATVLY